MATNPNSFVYDIELDSPIYIKDLPRVLAKYGVHITARRAIDIATLRLLPFVKCSLTGLLCTTERDIRDAVFGSRDEARRTFVAQRDLKQAIPRTKRGRPRGSRNGGGR